MPGVKQPCPMVAACWSPAMPQNRGSRRRTARAASRRSRRRSRAPPAAAPRHAEQLAQVVVPAAAGCRTAACARHWWRRWRGPCRRSAATAGTNRPCRRRAGRCSAAARAPIDMVEQPGDLGGREIRIEHQAGFLRDRGLMPGRAQRRAGVGGAAVLPDDGVVDRPAVDAIPDDRGLALVGDADAGDVLGAEPALAIASRTVATTADQISSGSCSTQPGAG